MARPVKRRDVCALPKFTHFIARPGKSQQDTIIMTVDEYETIRLIDYMGLNQEECADLMSVARTTVQAIYVNARMKLAQMLVEGSSLLIEGGEFRLCDDMTHHAGKRGCGRGQGQGRRRMRQRNTADLPDLNLK